MPKIKVVQDPDLEIITRLLNIFDKPKSSAAAYSDATIRDLLAQKEGSIAPNIKLSKLLEAAVSLRLIQKTGRKSGTIYTTTPLGKGYGKLLTCQD